MAAFSNQHHYPFLLDSIFLLNSTSTDAPIKMPEFMEEGNMMNNRFLSQFNPPDYKFPDQENINMPLDATTFESSCIDHNSSSKVALSDNEPASSVTKNQSTVTSTVVDNNKVVESGEQVTQSTVTQIMDRKRKSRNNGSSSNSAQSKDPREVKSKKQKKCNGAQKAEEEKNPTDDKKNQIQKKVPEEPPKDYIHVRARRGQATDSHSLAERVRREKISERMKILQKLVPGCDKVTGKALMLDEIINYVQSLQNQVEFLSMKLASVSPMFYDFGMDQLDAFMVRPDQRLNGIATSVPMQSVPQCSPTQLTAFTNTTTTTNAAAAFGPVDNYPIFDSAAASSLLLQQGQRPNAFYQDNDSLLWDVDEQKQKLLNPSGFTNNLCSFH